MTETAERYVRQLGIYNPDERQQDAVTLVGVGGIGSFAALGVAKLGVPKITLYDPDEVEVHNIPNQLYDDTDVGNRKTHATADKVSAVAPTTRIEYHSVGLPHPEHPLSGVVVSGLDSMEARHDLWHEAIKLNPSVPLYLDARISGEFIVVYAANPTDMEDINGFERTLYSDDSAEELSCTERGIIDVGLQVGAMVTRLVRRHFTDREVPRINMMNMDPFVPTQGSWVPEV